MKTYISFNPYFIGLPILIFDLKGKEVDAFGNEVSILILLDYLFLSLAQLSFRH